MHIITNPRYGKLPIRIDFQRAALNPLSNKIYVVIKMYANQQNK